MLLGLYESSFINTGSRINLIMTKYNLYETQNEILRKVGKLFKLWHRRPRASAFIAYRSTLMLDTVSKVNNTYVEYVRQDLLLGGIFRKEVLFGWYDMKSELDHTI